MTGKQREEERRRIMRNKETGKQREQDSRGRTRFSRELLGMKCKCGIALERKWGCHTLRCR